MSELHPTALHGQHAALGAAFSELHGFQVPKGYGSLEEEYQALRQGAGIADRSFLAKLEIIGKDAVDYLERMTSNEVRKLEPGQGCHNTLLTDRGKLVADFRLYRLEDRVLMDLQPERKKPLLEPLEKFVIMDDVKITDISDRFGILGVYGPKSTALLSSVFRLDLPKLNEFSHFAAFYGGEDILVACRHFTGEEGYEIWAPVELLASLWDDLLKAAPAHSARPAGTEALNIARIEAGIPLFGFEMDENTIPPEAGLGPVCSVIKGCYIGQEIISRIHHQGHVNRRLVGLKFPGRLPEVGAEIKDGDRKIGKVSSVAHSPALGCGIGLSVLRTEYSEPGKRLSVQDKEGLTELEVASLPFVRHV